MDFDDPIQTVGSHGDITGHSDAESVSSVASSVSSSRSRNRMRKKKHLNVTKKTHNVTKQKDIFGPKLSTREFQHILRDESKVAVELLSRKNLLSKLLQKDDIEQEMMTCLLNILVILSGSWNKDVQEVFSFLAELNFIEVHLLHYTIQWRLCPGKDSNTATNVIAILRAFRRCILPSSANASLVAAVVHDALRFEKILINARRLQECLGTCRELMSCKLDRPRCEMQADDEPPDSIFPRAGEVVDPQQTKAEHLCDGEPSVSNYLDIHYKLRREDIVDPLRKVISKYHLVKRSKGVAQAIKECRVYTGVHQHEVITSHTSKGITIRVQIDVSHLANYVNWETTKILSYGSLVCLTSNHFHSMAFATVAKRDPIWLKKGFLDLRFMRHEDAIALITGRQFFMIDTQHYFEETYEVLEALQGTISDCLPLAHHLVYLCAGEERPIHLKKGEDVKYDIGPLVKSESATRSSAHRTWTVPVLEPEEWPSIENLNVDEHQLKAVHRALSQEVTVITGHPGTGKSYTGLKIAQLLLLNKHRWASSTGAYSNERADDPLLFICSTKAALDEFLAGVTTFQRSGIVRCGGPHGRKAHQQYNLEKYREKHASDIASKDDICSGKLEKCKERIDTIKANIEHLRKSILPDEVLRSVIEPPIYNSFIERSTAGTAVLDWLLQSDVSESELQCLKEDGSWRAARFTTGENKDKDEWLEDKLPCAFSLEAAHLQSDTRNKLSKKLVRNDMLSASDLKQVSDLWKLTAAERWQLYHTWLKEIECRATKRLKIVCEDMDAVSTESQKLHDEVDARIFREAALIGMTASSAVKHRRALHHANPAIVIFSEPADILQSTTVAVLPPGIQQLILIGDGLPVDNNFSSVRELAERQNASASLIQHFIKNDYAVCNLLTQHRMSPTVSKLSRLISGEDYQSHQSVVNLPDVSGIERNVFFIDHINEESPANHEASFLLTLFDYLIKQGYSRYQISIITTFPAQLHLFQKGDVGGRVFAIDGFRGDSDIVLFMSNGSDRNRGPGSILREQRLPFILTRARIGLYVIGNFSFLSKQCPVWERLLQEVLRLEWVDSCLNITCPHHPKSPTAVSTVEEFKRRNEGNGCGLSCQARLDCGHCCKEVCHDHDLKKASVICSQPCNRDVCKYGHKCMNLCSEPCETKCRGKTEKELPCGHQQLLPCYLPVEKAKCRDKCKRLLRCGHKCTGICGDRCKEEKCIEPTKKTDWPCGHTVEVPCCSGPDTCPEPCGVVLACGHMCSGTCGKCRRGRLHIVCEQPCGRTLVCGHSCESNCAAQCPPCSRRCENKCQHSDCRKLCGEPCIPCRENCLWCCPHSSCQNLCGEPCKREPCDEPCPKTLPCGHNCIGMCGEKCPTKCRICNMAEVTEILFGGEDEDDARFVELEDCGHVIEVEALDHYMNMSQEGEDAINIQMKGCPKCKTPIRRNLRYGDVIKKALKDVENVKVKIRGSQSEIDQKTREMKKKMAELRRHAAYHGKFIREEDFTKISEGLKTMPHLEKVLARVNRCAFLRAIADIWDKSRSAGSYIGALLMRQKDLQKCLNELADEIVGGDLDRFTEQQMNDFQQEISRLDLRAHVITLLQRNMPSLLKLLQCSAVTSFDTLVNQPTPFTKDDEKQAKKIVQRIRKSVGCVVLGISNKERVEIVRAIGLGQGHWYRCPRGHVYAIGECGGAVVQANCPECGAAIGGQSHSLTSGNRVASEMDGAQQAAWPTGQEESDEDNDDMVYQAHGMEFGQQDIEEQFEIERQIIEDQERERQRERQRQQERQREQARQLQLERFRLEQERVERERVERNRRLQEELQRRQADRNSTSKKSDANCVIS